MHVIQQHRRKMPSVWADSVEAASADSIAAAAPPVGAASRPTRSTYVPPHLRNRNQGATEPASPSPAINDNAPQLQYVASPQYVQPQYGLQPHYSASPQYPPQYGPYVGVPPQFATPPPFARPGGGRPPPSSGKPWGRNGGGAPAWANGGGRSWGGRRETEANPFAKEANEAIFDQENTGINFDAYEDIPVEASGDNVPPPITSFGDVDLGPILNENIRRCKFVKPTPVQKHAIPISLGGRDLMACAQTGSGKTAAFCFPIIAGILRNSPPGRQRGHRKAFPLALILSPTRELSSQIHDEARKFAFQTGVRVVVAYGGAPVQNQLRDLDKGVEIMVATPGRLSDLLERGKVSLSMIRYLALDEADRMLDMGFEPQIRKIVETTDMPPAGQRQTMLFSATFPREIQRLAADFLWNYIFLAVGRVGSSTDLIAQRVEYVPDADKRSLLMDMIHAQKPNGVNGQQPLMLVFVETKRGADALEDWLVRMGFPATTIHGDRTQSEREQALRSFRHGLTPILVATDVAARGLDIPHVAHVINYDLPSDIDDYVHRIGRTGRAGKSGLATAFFSDKDTPLARALADLMQESNQEVPGWLLNFAKMSSFGKSHRSGGSRFGGRDYRRKGGKGGGYGGGHGGGYGGGHGGGGYGYGGGASNAWES